MSLCTMCELEIFEESKSVVFRNHQNERTSAPRRIADMLEKYGAPV